MKWWEREYIQSAFKLDQNSQNQIKNKTLKKKAKEMRKNGINQKLNLMIDNSRLVSVWWRMWGFWRMRDRLNNHLMHMSNRSLNRLCEPRTRNTLKKNHFERIGEVSWLFSDAFTSNETRRWRRKLMDYWNFSVENRESRNVYSFLFDGRLNI